MQGTKVSGHERRLFFIKQNVGTIDRIIRIVLGVALLGLLFLPTGVRWVGLVGLIPLVTGIAGFCPLYALLKINTNKKK